MQMCPHMPMALGDACTLLAPGFFLTTAFPVSPFVRQQLLCLQFANRLPLLPIIYSSAGAGTSSLLTAMP